MLKMPFQKSDTKIQLLSSKQFEEVFELLRSIYENQNPEHPMGGSWTRSMVRKELEIGKGQGFFDASGYLRGIVLYRVLSGTQWDISVLGCHPQWRGKGIMTQLLKNMQHEMGTGSLWLEVHEENHPAICLYEKLGFQNIGMRPSYYRDGCAAVLYSLNLVSSNEPLALT